MNFIDNKKKHWIRCASRIYPRAIIIYFIIILCMNDFSNASKIFYTILLADDKSVFLEGTEDSKLIETVNYELNKVTLWLNIICQ